MLLDFACLKKVYIFYSYFLSLLQVNSVRLLFNFICVAKTSDLKVSILLMNTKMQTANISKMYRIQSVPTDINVLPCGIIAKMPFCHVIVVTPK